MRPNVRTSGMVSTTLLASFGPLLEKSSACGCPQIVLAILLLRPKQSQGYDSSNPLEVSIRREQDQVVRKTEPRKQRVDRADLRPSPATSIPERRGLDMVLSIRDKKWKRSEAVDDRPSIPRTVESLQQLLQDQTGRKDGIALGEVVRQGVDLAMARCDVPPQRERPDARVDEDVHRLERSAL